MSKGKFYTNNHLIEDDLKEPVSQTPVTAISTAERDVE
jgi:hypothetical protein